MAVSNDTSISVFKSIPIGSVNIVPYNVYKNWIILSGSSTSSCLPLTGIYSDISILPALGSELTYNDSKNIDGSLQSITYHSINHLFYKRKQQPWISYNKFKSSKFLYETASVFSFPQSKIGNGIQLNSFILQTTSSEIGMQLRSDLNGNVIDTQINTSSFIPETKFYEGFNEYYDASKLPVTLNNDNLLQKTDRYINGTLNIVPGIKSTSGYTSSIGHAAEFNTSNILVVPNSSILGEYDREHDYAISFFISASSTGTNLQTVIGKSGTRIPYHITVDANKKIRFYVHGSNPNPTNGAYVDVTKTKNMFVSSSTAVSSSWNHVVCQKSGSYMQIYVNGALQSNIYQPLLVTPTSPSTQSLQISSNGDTFIGGWNTGSASYNYNGKLDEIRFYNKALSSTEVSYLRDLHETGSMLQTNVVGNIFNLHGLVVVSSANYIYNDILQSPYTASYNSTITRHELSVPVKANAGEFNMSLNVSLTKDNNVTYMDFIESDDFKPYITTIGLYDTYGRLLAIGKLGQPIKKRNDIDLTFIVKLDLDNA